MSSYVPKYFRALFCYFEVQFLTDVEKRGQRGVQNHCHIVTALRAGPKQESMHDNNNQLQNQDLYHNFWAPGVIVCVEFSFESGIGVTQYECLVRC